MKLMFVVFLNVLFLNSRGQDSIPEKRTSMIKDERIDLLGKKMAEYNESLANRTQMVRGYRLMLLSTTDRSQAMQLRSALLQQYPEHKVYMTFLSPYIKIKFGNFLEKDDAEKMRKQLNTSKIVTGNIYLVPEMIESKPEKTAPSEDPK
jgi:hypothetical protein